MVSTREKQKNIRHKIILIPNVSTHTQAHTVGYKSRTMDLQGNWKTNWQSGNRKFLLTITSNINELKYPKTKT